MTPSRCRSRLSAVACLVALAVVLGCSGKGGPPSRVGAEFTDADARLFDEGVDFISSALALEGRWREEWIQEVHGRIDRADAVVAVRVKTVRTDISPQREETYRLGVEVADVLQGSVREEELTLTTTPASRGYRTVDAHTESLEAGAFLLFAKWAEDEEGQAVLHWHLSPDSEDMRAVVNKRAGARSGSGKTTTVYIQKD